MPIDEQTICPNANCLATFSTNVSCSTASVRAAKYVCSKFGAKVDRTSRPCVIAVLGPLTRTHPGRSPRHSCRASISSLKVCIPSRSPGCKPALRLVRLSHNPLQLLSRRKSGPMLLSEAEMRIGNSKPHIKQAPRTPTRTARIVSAPAQPTQPVQPSPSQRPTPLSEKRWVGDEDLT